MQLFDIRMYYTVQCNYQYNNYNIIIIFIVSYKVYKPLYTAGLANVFFSLSVINL